MTREQINSYIAHAAGTDPQTVERVLAATEHFVQTHGGGKLGSIMALYQNWKRG